MRGMRGRSGFGISQFIMGLCLIVLGAFTCLRPRSIFTGIAVIYGVAAVITGICDIVIYIKEERFSGFGPVVSLVAGILSLLFPLWFITHCISRLAHTALIRYVAGNFYYYFSLAVNILGLVLGFVMLLQPILTFLTLGYLIGLCLIAFGVECILLAFSDMGSRW